MLGAPGIPKPPAGAGLLMAEILRKSKRQSSRKLQSMAHRQEVKLLNMLANSQLGAGFEKPQHGPEQAACDAALANVPSKNMQPEIAVARPAISNQGTWKEDITRKMQKALEGPGFPC